MENENEVVKEEAVEVVVEDETPEPEEPKVEKPKESDEDRLARWERQASQLRKKLGKDVETPKPKSSDLDYGQKAYLISNGIKGADEIALVKEVMSSTGKSLDEVIESKYFQAELKERREEKIAKDAIPNGTKRSGQSSRDTVEYWIAKGELPQDRELRTKVVNARIKAETQTNVFTDQNVVR